MRRLLASSIQHMFSKMGIRQRPSSQHLTDVIKVIEPAFDRNWYVAQDPDISRSGLDPVLHYVLVGADRGLDPHPRFSTRRYLRLHQDVLASGMNPFYHWLRFGQAEGRENTGAELDTAAPGNPDGQPCRNAMFTVFLCCSGRSSASIDASLASLAQQSHRNFEVILLGCDDAGRSRELLLSSRGLFCEPTRRPADILRQGGDTCWRGDYLMMLEAGDILEPEALASLSFAAAQNDEGAELLVCDYFSGPEGVRRSVPGLDIALLAHCDYLLSSCAMSRPAVLRATAAGAHDGLYPMVLSAAEAGMSWKHVAQPLLRIQSGPTPVPFDVAGEDVAGGVSIIIPNRDRPDLLANCTRFLHGLRMPFQLVIVDNGSTDPRTEGLYGKLRTEFGAEILRVDHAFNYSRMVNLGATAATHDVLLFLNNDVTITNPAVVSTAVNYAKRPGVGVVGSVMWYPKGDLQHAGLVFWLDPNGGIGSDHILRHAERPNDDSAPFSPLSNPREWQAVTGAFHVVRRDIFDAAGGYDDCNLPVEHNDVDFCFRIRAMGLRVVCLPLPDVTHDESSTRRNADPGATRRMRDLAHRIMRSRWLPNFLDDPFFHPHERQELGAARLAERLGNQQRFMHGQAGGRPAHQRGILPDAWSPRHLKPGACIIGYLNSEVGLGEAARNLGRACDAARLPTSYVNRPLDKRSNEPVIESFFQQRADRRLTLRIEGLSLDGYNMNDEGLGRLQVYYPYWELPRIPDGARAMLDRYDEIWAGSTFIATALREATRRPVRLIPQPLDVPALPPEARARPDTFRFLTFFDFDSFIARKNPLASIAAFRAAFPSRKDVELVVKARGLANEKARRMVSAAIAGDRRIRLIDATLSRNEMRNLISDADAFVSLHRAEGFGFGAAEAFAAGKAVIATNWSATSEFVTPETGFPVDYTLRAVGPSEYIHPEGQVWADPIAESAVEQFLAVADNPEAASAKARKGHALLLRHNSFAAVGRRIADALRDLNAI